MSRDHLRLFVEVAHDIDARRVARGVVTLLAPHVMNVTTTVRPYWKIREYFEISLLFDARGSLDVLTATLGTGWRFDDRNELVAYWDVRDGGALHIAEARWAHLEIATPLADL